MGLYWTLYYKASSTGQAFFAAAGSTKPKTSVKDGGYHDGVINCPKNIKKVMTAKRYTVTANTV